MKMNDKVECRSDHAYIGYPVAFYWQDLRLDINEIISENHTPNGYSFLVRNEKHGTFELCFDVITDEWSVEQH